MAHVFQGREGALRIYDGNNPPYYVEIPFVQMNFSAPMARARPLDPIVPTVGGYIHAPTGSDYDQGFYEPSTASFTAWVEARSFPTLQKAMSNTTNLGGSWQVGSHYWTSTKGRGSIIMADGTYRATQPFFDQLKVTGDIQVRWQDVKSGSLMAMRYDEAYFAPQSVPMVETADFVEVNVTATVYGNIQPIANFSTGTASLPYEE